MITVTLAAHPTASGLPPSPPARTLADVHPGESVRVAAIAPGFHALLTDLGLGTGARVRCESAARYLIVRTRSGCVPLELGLAAAVDVSALTDDEDAGR